jgi:hypothetical protein
VAKTTVWYVLLTIFGKLIVEQACRRDNLRVSQVGRAIGRHRESAYEYDIRCNAQDAVEMIRTDEKTNLINPYWSIEKENNSY